MSPMTSKRAISVMCSVAAIAGIFMATNGELLAEQASIEHPTGVVLPTRRTPDAPPAQPEALPSMAGHVSSLKVSVVFRFASRAAAKQTRRQTITRTAGRIHIATEKNGEWLFEQNILDPRRVSGTLVDHASRTLVIYSESDLRNMREISGWADVLTMGFDPSVLDALRSSGKTRTVGDIRCLQYAGAKDDRAQEVWWSAEELFPCAFVIRDTAGSTEFVVEQIQRTIDANVLQRPSLRFPDYRSVDVADWLERTGSH